MHDLDDFTRAYIECALWISTDDDGESFDGAESDLAPTTLESMVADCADFQDSNAGILESACAADPRYSLARAGHDFWLTRNRHGAGFWDRGLPCAIAKELTADSHAWGEVNLYRGDDGLIYS